MEAVYNMVLQAQMKFYREGENVKDARDRATANAILAKNAYDIAVSAMNYFKAA